MSCDPLKILTPPKISTGRLKLETILYTGLSFEGLVYGLQKFCPLSGHGPGHVMSLNFLKISNNITETVQDKDVVTIEKNINHICPSNIMTANDLESV